MKKQEEALRNVILAVEWGHDDVCPWCDCNAHYGHDPSCPRQAVLNATATPEMEQLVGWIGDWKDRLLLDGTISVGELALRTEVLDAVQGRIAVKHGYGEQP